MLTQFAGRIPLPAQICLQQGGVKGGEGWGRQKDEGMVGVDVLSTRPDHLGSLHKTPCESQCQVHT